MQSIYARKVTFNKQGKNNKFQVRMIIPIKIVKKMRLSQKNNQINIIYDPLTDEIRIKSKKSYINSKRAPANKTRKSPVKE